MEEVRIENRQMADDLECLAQAMHRADHKHTRQEQVKLATLHGSHNMPSRCKSSPLGSFLIDTSEAIAVRSSRCYARRRLQRERRLN